MFVWWGGGGLDNFGKGGIRLGGRKFENDFYVCRFSSCCLFIFIC